MTGRDRAADGSGAEPDRRTDTADIPPRRAAASTHAVAEEWNWGGTYRYRARAIHHPRTLDELRRAVSGTGTRHVLGTRHSFNDLSDADELISLSEMPGDAELDTERRQVLVPAGIRYGDLARFLDARGWALGNMASLPHISVAGSVATGTHGSGDTNGSLASQVVGLRLLTASGDLVEFGPQSPELAGAVVASGALGVVTALTLQVEPTYVVRQDVFEGLSWEGLTGGFDAIMAAGYSVSVMTTLSGPVAGRVWVKSRLDQDPPPSELFARLGTTAATRDLHPTPGQDATPCTPQLGRPGPWHDRLPHFRLEHTPSTGMETHSEYLMDRADGSAAIAALLPLGERITALVQSVEIRTVAADGLWLSPAYGRPTVGVHFTWLPDEPAVRELLPHVEAALEPFAPRPHWGKVFVRPSRAWTALYPRLPDFWALARTLDPHGRFRNVGLQRTVFAEEPARTQ